jgi:hypothetical protein
MYALMILQMTYHGLDFDDIFFSSPYIPCDALQYINPGDELLVAEM